MYERTFRLYNITIETDDEKYETYPGEVTLTLVTDYNNKDGEDEDLLFDDLFDALEKKLGHFVFDFEYEEVV